MKKFPILKLPLLATEEVLKQLSFYDIYPLSKCSKRCSKMISLAHTRSYTLDISPWVSSLFNIKVDHLNLIIPKDRQRQNSRDPKFIDNMFEELRAELSHLLTTFKFHQKSFHSSGIWTLERNQSLLETIIREQGSTFEDFTLRGNDGVMSNQWILENIKVDNILTIYVSLPEKRLIFKTCPKIFRSFDSSWITLDTLISIGDCKVIQVSGNVLLTATEINTFMEMWKADMFPTLEYLYLGDIKLKDNEMILGFTQEQLSVERVDRWKIISSKRYYCIGGVDIRSNGGVNGTFYYDEIFKSVLLFVWKD